MLFPSFESMLSQGSLIFIFILMLSNGFFSFPSSQLLYITVGFFVAQGKIAFLPVLLLGALGNTLGNYLLYLVTSKYGEKTAKRFLPIKDEMFEALKETFKEKSLFYLAIGKMTPSLKVIIPILAGIAKTHKQLTLLVFLVTSTIWATVFLSLGVFFGKSFSLGIYGVIMGVIGLLVALYFTTILQKKIEKKGEGRNANQK
jgi:membrane protein DedA with SNARE-associated domain